jgi:hypothetical protein
VYADDATIGWVAVTGQAVQAATSVSPAFSTETGHGILGLGFSNMNTCQAKEAEDMVRKRQILPDGAAVHSQPEEDGDKLIRF